MDPITGSLIGGVVGKILDLARVKIGDPEKIKELENEAIRIAADAEIRQMETDQQRLATVQTMLGNKSLFVSGAIPAFLWVVPLTVIFNCWIMPTLNYLGPFMSKELWVPVEAVWLPSAYMTVVGVIITGLFGKKIIDNNAFFGKDGHLMSPPKQLVDAMVTQSVQGGDSIEDRFNKLVKQYNLKEEGKKNG